MAIKDSGAPLSMTEINSEFAYGTNLGSYNGKQWYKFDGTLGSFSLPISYSDFFGKQKSASYTYIDVKTSTDITVPKSQSIALLIVAGGGAGWPNNAYPLEGGSGGGAGGCIYTDFVVPVQAGGIIRCTIGAGAAYNYNSYLATSPYSNSIFIGRDTIVSHIVNGSTVWTYTAKGGGAGGTYLSRGSGETMPRSGGSGAGNCPFYGRDDSASYYGRSALSLNPMQGNNGGYGVENVTSGGGGGWGTTGYSGGGGRWGEAGGLGANGGDGKTISQFGWTGSVGGGGAGSGGASGGQWVTFGNGGLGGGASTFLISSGSAVGDWWTGYINGAGSNNAAVNTGGGGGGTWACNIITGPAGRGGPPNQPYAGSGGSGRVVIWYNP